jgi:hypothetical protein
VPASPSPRRNGKRSIRSMGHVTPPMLVTPEVISKMAKLILVLFLLRSM